MADPTSPFGFKDVSGDEQKARTDDKLGVHGGSDKELPAMMHRLDLGKQSRAPHNVGGMSKLSRQWEQAGEAHSSTGAKSAASSSRSLLQTQPQREYEDFARLIARPVYVDHADHLVCRGQQKTPAHMQNKPPVFTPKSTDYMSRTRERAEYKNQRTYEFESRKDYTADEVNAMINECKQLCWVDYQEHRDYLLQNPAKTRATHELEEKARKCRDRELAELNREKNSLLGQLPALTQPLSPNCVFCGLANHYNSTCPNVPLNAQRIELLKAEGRCLKCLSPSHTTSDCRSRKKCYHCKAYPSDHNHAICPLRSETGAGDDDEHY